jgi:hypothetical protein
MVTFIDWMIVVSQLLLDGKREGEKLMISPLLASAIRLEPITRVFAPTELDAMNYDRLYDLAIILNLTPFTRGEEALFRVFLREVLAAKNWEVTV